MRFLYACAPRVLIQSIGRFVRANCGSSCVLIFLMSLVATLLAKSSRPALKPPSSRPVISWSAFLDLRQGGAYAELAVAKKTAVALKSPSLSFTEAASLPIAACTALQALRDLGKLSEGANALILGGAGGVGHFAVQIAKALGAKTSATCGPSNIEFVQSLGADYVIDYSGKDFTAQLDRYDVIFDAVGKSSFVACRPLLAPGGTYVTTLPKPSVFFWSGVH
jgi:NADPH:quinone reductase-like Zn-dependent oxidoreductase